MMTSRTDVIVTGKVKAAVLNLADGKLYHLEIVVVVTVIISTEVRQSIL